MTTVTPNTFVGANAGANYVPGTEIQSAPMNTDLNAVEVDLDTHIDALDTIYALVEAMDVDSTNDQTAEEIVNLINASGEIIEIDNVDITTITSAIATAVSNHKSTTTDVDMHGPQSIQDMGIGYTVTPGAFETSPVNLTNELNNVRRAIKVLIGGTTWVDAPTLDINTIAGYFTAGAATPKDHASTHITSGSDQIAIADPGVSSGLMSADMATKLDVIEPAATADQTAAEIRTLIGSATDCNVFDNDLKAKLDGSDVNATNDQTDAEIRALVASATNSNVFTDGLKAKLDAIEPIATTDQTASEIRTLVDTATNSNVFDDTLKSKLDVIEPAATADQTASEIRTLVDAATNSNVFDDTLKGKLDGIATSANLYVHPTGDGNLHVPVNGTGNNGKVLTASSTAGVYTWAISKNADTLILNTRTATTNDSIDANDYTVLGNATSGDITLTLPAVGGNAGRIYNIKKIDVSENSVIIDGASLETIDGELTYMLSIPYESITIQCTGTEWFII